MPGAGCLLISVNPCGGLAVALQQRRAENNPQGGVFSRAAIGHFDKGLTFAVSGGIPMISRLKKILIILNLKALIVTVLAVGSTWLCIKYNIQADFPLTLIATAIIFPIVFSIGGAYKRREAALKEYGVLKAHGRAIYFAVRDWLDKPDDVALERARVMLAELLTSCRTLFVNPVADMRKNEELVYKEFSDISKFIRTDLREKGLASGEVSRCNQYLSKMFQAFENIKHVYQYRTPVTLRAFSDFFITVLPPLYGPYFAHIAVDYSTGLTYAMPVLFALVLTSLDNIQEHLENPFDQVGEDDLYINVEQFVRRLY